MAEVHDWHLFDAEAGLEARQATAEGEPNRWEVRRTGAGDDIKRLDDERFDGLRSGRLAFEEL